MTEPYEKRLSSRERGEPESIARLRSEATLLGLLAASGVVPRLVGRGEDDNGPYFRTERLAFPTLAERIQSSAPLATGWVEQATRASYAALATLHEARDDRGPLEIVHADLTPSNLAVADDGAQAIVLDFDLASWRDGPPRNDGAFRGTIGYVAPEIARGEKATAQSDLFSLAASLLHALTGDLAPSRRPASASASFAALLMHAAEIPLVDASVEPLGKRGPGHAAILACLALDPRERPATAREVLARLPPGPPLE